MQNTTKTFDLKQQLSYKKPLQTPRPRGRGRKHSRVLLLALQRRQKHNKGAPCKNEKDGWHSWRTIPAALRMKEHSGPTLPLSEHFAPRWLGRGLQLMEFVDSVPRQGRMLPGLEDYFGIGRSWVFLFN